MAAASWRLRGAVAVGPGRAARRRGRARTPDSVRVGRWSAATLALGVCVGAAAALRILLQLAPGGGARALALASALGLLILPSALRALQRQLGADRPGLPDVEAVRFFLFPALLAAVARCGLLPALVAVLLLAQGLLLRRPGDVGAAGATLLAALLLAVLAVFHAPGGVSLALLTLSIFALCLASGVLHARHARREVARFAHRARLVEEGREGLASRAARALPMALAILVLGLIGHNFGRHLAGFELPTLSFGGQPSAESRADRPAGTEEAPSPEAGERSIELEVAGWLGGGSTPARPGHEILMAVRLFDAGGAPIEDGRPLRLRRAIYDRYQDETPRVAPLRGEWVLDEGDGALDGWVELQAAPPGSAAYRVEIRERPRPVPGGELVALARPDGLLAAAASAIWFDPDGILAASATDSGFLRYRLRAFVPRPPYARLLRARHPDRRYVALPPTTPELERLAERARSMASGAANDLEAVQGLVARLRSFRYSLESTRGGGLSGLVDFLEKRRGYCTHFAQAGMLLSRCLGLPARLVIGHNVHEWDEEQGRYLVRHRHGHAWFEVCFEGFGWVPFDATPPGYEDVLDSFTAEDVAVESGLAPWVSQTWTATRRVLEGREGGLAELGATLGRGPDALVESWRRNPWAVAGTFGVLALTVLFFLLPRLARRARALGLRTPGREPSDFYYDRLLRRLARLGFRKLPSQTPLEFARWVLRAGSGALQPLERVTQLLYRSRFGGIPLAREERGEIEGFIAELRSLSPGAARPASPAGSS